MADYFSTLGDRLVLQIFSYISYDSRRISWYSSLSSQVNAVMHEEYAWRGLCHTYWYATDERLREWPKLSARGLYRALEQWAPLEGYYVLAPSFPWGLLVLLRIVEGRVCADVIRFLPVNGGEFQEVHVPLFQVNLSEEGNGNLRSTVDAPWFGGNPAEISSLDPQKLCAHTQLAARVFSSCFFCEAGILQCRRALRISVSNDSKAGDADTDAVGDASVVHLGELEGNPLEHVWYPGELLSSRDDALRRTEGMLTIMLGEKGIPCDLGLLRSPEDYVPQAGGFPGLRPGLYVGDYGQPYYGQYRTEVLLLEYQALSQDELRQEATHPTRIFARPMIPADLMEGLVTSSPPPEELRNLAELGTEVTFMRGVKQCGDFHVPLGATTFVAVCGPQEVCAAVNEDRAPPASALNRQTGQIEGVTKAWRGWGTLAQPGFNRPSWANGWLVQFADRDMDGSHRFGFVWDRSQDAVVLHWIAAQDTSPFLQRAWLPESLQ